MPVLIDDDLLFEDGALSDLVLTTFIARREALQQMQGIGLEIIGPRSSEASPACGDGARCFPTVTTPRSSRRRARHGTPCPTS